MIKDADALYIELFKGVFAKNKKVNDTTILDPDKKGKVIGIEIRRASAHMSPESLHEAPLKVK